MKFHNFVNSLLSNLIKSSLIHIIMPETHFAGKIIFNHFIVATIIVTISHQKHNSVFQLQEIIQA